MVRYGCKRSRGGDANARLYHEGGDLNVSYQGRPKREGEHLDQQLLPIVPGLGCDAHHRVIAAPVEPITDYCP